MGRKRTSGVSHNKNSKTYKTTNRTEPSSSRVQSSVIQKFFRPVIRYEVYIEGVDKELYIEMEYRRAFSPVFSIVFSIVAACLLNYA